MAEGTPADPVVEPARLSRLPRISLAWLVPLVALAVSLGVAWRTFSERGPIIEILFQSAAGIVPGETTLRFRDFTIGLVETLGFTEDLSQVVAHVRLQRDIAPYVDSGATFWLVRAQVGPRGITGLETVLTGVYIEASFDTTEGEPQRRFTALTEPPLTPAGQPGMRVMLRSAAGGSIAAGAPVLFKQIAVGKIETVELTPEGEVAVSAFIDAPHDDRLSTATRFWNASGFTFELGGGGAQLRVDSLASLVQGGIAFDTVAALGAPIGENHVFRLYDSEAIARNSLLTGADWEQPVRFAAIFDGSVRGLRVGNDVEYRGLRVGEVTGIQARTVEGPDGPRVQLHVTMDVLPNRFGIPEGEGAEEAVFDLVEAGIRRGLRAQIASQGLLGGALYVNFVELPDMPPASFDRAELPVPVVPSAPTEAGDMMAAASGIIRRVAELPLEEVVDSAVTLLDNAGAILADEGVRQAPTNLGLVLADIRELIAGDAVQQAPAELTALLASARGIVDDLAERQVAADLAATLQAVGTAADELPAAVEGVLSELRPLLADLREGGAVENVNATLAAVRGITDEIAAAQLAESLRTTLASVEGAVGNVATASEGLPELLASLTELSQEARALPLDELVASVSRTADGIEAFVTSEGVAALPATAEASLAELRELLAGLRAEGGPVENAGAALASIRAVADEIAAAQLAETLRGTLTAVEGAVGDVGAAAEGLPELLASLTALTQKAEALPLDELVASGTQALAAADRLLASEAVGQVPAEVNAALAELRTNLATLREGGAVDNANATLAALRRVADEVAAAELAESLRATLAGVQSAVGNVDTAAAGLPPLLDSLAALTEEARALPLDELVDSAARVLATADALIASEAVVEVPQSVNLALAELRLILAEVREGGAIENASASLASVRALTEEMAAAELAASLRTTLAAVESAVGNVDTAAQDLPQLLANLTRLSEQVGALPLEDVVASGRKVLDSADRLLASEGMAEVPTRLAAALDELRQVLAELREGGAVQSLNATLASADEAAAAVAAAADALPALAAQLSAEALRAEQAIGSFGPGSDINRDTLLLLRELRDTAKSVNALVVQLERRPNSVLFGR